MAALQLKIELLPAEQLLREFLLECSQFAPGLEIWITGGWVRDRLLGIPSSDLDLALNNLTGNEFVKVLRAFSARPEIESKYSEKAAYLGIPQPYMSRAHITKKNLKMSKKLETAGCTRFGMDVDLVNLRKEVYDGKSRNPDMEFGTAAEDASRRDATVNAIFFHLERQEDHEVHEALDTIITRDRVGAELDKMITGSNTATAFNFIFDFHLYSPVFVRPDSAVFAHLASHDLAWGTRSTSSPRPTNWPLAYNMLARILVGQSNLSPLIRSYGVPEQLWLLAAYSPLAELRRTLRKEIVREASSSIKATASATKLLDDSLRNFSSIRTIVDCFADRPGRCCSRSECGMAIRSRGSTWIAQLTYVLLAETLHQDTTEDSKTGCQVSASEELLKKYANLADFVCQQKLRSAVLESPLLNGLEVMELFELEEGGKYLKTVTQRMVKWQFDNTEATKEDCKKWLLKEKDVLGLPPRS
ncbi:hypothetical protein LLEC1_00803 [Akanthomyces lecanii]|uniref:Poly A polymerase head domain-containing protein n=1 Tax=Cordyceps confragosa TaxID=2714763 RepID=A0A179I756_CORDF|nr:hypothetical protein LLEC1_00803 [Akanthomyces lecanii]